jgi:hypothetical protein
MASSQVEGELNLKGEEEFELHPGVTAHDDAGFRGSDEAASQPGHQLEGVSPAQTDDVIPLASAEPTQTVGAPSDTSTHSSGKKINESEATMVGAPESLGIPSQLKSSLSQVAIPPKPDPSQLENGENGEDMEGDWNATSAYPAGKNPLGEDYMDYDWVPPDLVEAFVVRFYGRFSIKYGSPTPSRPCHRAVDLSGACEGSWQKEHLAARRTQLLGDDGPLQQHSSETNPTKQTE